MTAICLNPPSPISAVSDHTAYTEQPLTRNADRKVQTQLDRGSRQGSNQKTAQSEENGLRFVVVLQHVCKRGVALPPESGDRFLCQDKRLEGFVTFGSACPERSCAVLGAAPFSAPSCMRPPRQNSRRSTRRRSRLCCLHLPQAGSSHSTAPRSRSSRCRCPW